MSISRPQRTRAQDEAAAWLARLGNPVIRTDTVRAFEAWRDDPANDAAYTEAEAFWEASGQQAADPAIMRMTEQALARKRRPPLLQWLKGPRLALTLTLAAATAAGSGYLVTHGFAPTHATQASEQKVVRLEDGSRIHLNVDSAVRVRFANHERRLTLNKGEAFFDVAHDPARPFVVEAAGAEVRALGTKFDIRRNPEGVEVTLLQGQVRVTPDTGPSMTLTPNQRATVSPSGHIARAATDAAQSTSWTTGRLMFRNTPLATAIAEVNRYGDHPVQLTDPKLGVRPVSGFFDVGDTKAFARGMAEILDLQMTTAPDGAIRLAPGAGQAVPPGAPPGA